MNTYNVNLTVVDTVIDNCNNKSSQKKTLLVTSTSQTVELQDCYILNIIAVTENMFTVLIQNGIQVIVRNIYTTFATDICLPSECKKHLLTISGNILNA